MSRSLVAAESAVSTSAPVNAETVAASLLVLAHAGSAEAVTGELTDLTTGRSATVSLPWRARRAVLVATVGKQLTRLGASPPTMVRVGHGEGPYIVVTGGRVAPSADAALLAGRVDRILDEAGDGPVGAIDLCGEEDARIIAAAHRAGGPPRDSVPALVRAQALTQPTAIAIEDTVRQVSYAALVRAADRYANDLRKAGVGPGDTVAVGMARRAELVVTLLAVWSLRAVFLPVDPTHPRARLETLLDAADARFAVLTDPRLVTRPDCRAVAPPAEDLIPVGGADPVGGAAPTDGDLAYAISTSGSTGRPKVVGVSHAALAHCVTTFADVLELDTPTVAGTTALTFDISLLEILLPLATGGRLLLVDDAMRRDPVRLGEYLSAGRPDLIQATPSGWRLLLPHLPPDLTGSTLLCGGEAVTSELAGRLVGTGASVWNVYGPTEATIWCTAHRVGQPVPDSVPIGVPLPGTTAVVRGRNGRPVPIGQVGELHVGGPQLAVGYLGDAERTAEVFRDGEYRTGDLCAWRPDGTLAYHGRVDNQVKIRGHRVELEEIETYAERHPAVSQAAAVVVAAAADDQRLFLYVRTGSDRAPVTEAILREHLAASLPVALLPQRIVALPELPLTPSQKVDRRALREAALTYLNRRTASGETPS
ncbi:amino acid adenylation domain-containing protein [Verrucosispora sp. WMMD573]|uniref:amino acid adenylation domain-containing protein n=1 Tax=Verrucosispora sp. WMMD573 TaxID=3015149 RepID=UPI00248B9960|nr:amino acid adenylation domain-containing protein [Verrucosispora sp. WMMD573]WBB56640.1 amino acid adenylation domain-containing protein [Verrucosispora sp. WMMD573]